MSVKRQESRVGNQKTRYSLLVAILLLAACCLLLDGAVFASQQDLMGNIKQAVEKELRNTISEDVEITGLKALEGMNALENLEGYKINTVAMNGYAGRNKVNFMVDLRDKRMSKKSIIVEASYDVLVDVFISSRPLIKGTMLSADDFYIVKQKSSRLPAGAVLSINDLQGKALKTNIGQGVILRGDYLTAQMSIKRGQKVDVVVEGNNIVISTQGTLRNDVIVGGTAKVLCDVSKKEIIGILTAPNTVRVKI